MDDRYKLIGKNPKGNWVVKTDENPSWEKSQSYRSSNQSSVWSPPTDVFETDLNIVVRVEIPGLVDEDFSISLQGNRLRVRGIRSDISTQEKKAYHQMEIRYGVFHSEVSLGFPIQPDQIEAEYTNGFLYVTIPKAKPHRVDVK